MNEAARKVIILNKLSSPYISEAIIILKNGTTIPQSRIIEEAEQIVRNYMERTSKNGHAPKRAARLCQWKTAAILCSLTAFTAFLICYLLFQ